MVTKPFLTKGNGHQLANRRKALDFAVKNVPALEEVDERTIKLPPYGVCHFAAYTHPEGAMISTPGRDDNDFGTAEEFWPDAGSSTSTRRSEGW